MVRTSKIISVMWALGMPTHDAKFANIYRAGLKAGLTEAQAFELTKEAYYAAKQYDWQLPIGGLQRATREANAAQFPQGKCAEDLLAQREGRKSRWGTPAFHLS